MATTQSGPGQTDASSGTLGDLLYADRGKPRAAEADWVALVRAIASGDQGSLRALYERSHRPVFTLMVRLTGNRETAEELTLDVFHGVWQRAGQYDPAGGSVLAWIMNQARSRAIDRLRFEQRRKRNGVLVEPLTADAGSTPDALDAERQARRLHEAVATLSLDERTAIETAYFAELTYAETAARLDQPLGTVKTRIRSAMRKLKAVLSGTGNGA